MIDTGERELVGFRPIAVNGLCKNQKLCALHFLHKTRGKCLQMVAIRNSPIPCNTDCKVTIS